jgi:hypothetical protein
LQQIKSQRRAAKSPHATKRPRLFSRATVDADGNEDDVSMASGNKNAPIVIVSSY